MASTLPRCFLLENLIRVKTAQRQYIWDYELTGSKNKTSPYDTSIHQNFGEVETQTHP